jgi:prostaglandin-H2 D-isomerase / glutathione transferase
MAKYKLTYFDFSGSRGEECRLALHVAGVDFEDCRLTQEQWAAHKASTPYGAVPVLEAAGKPPLAQSNAILTYVGRSYNLHPTDPWQAALHEAILVAAEEVRAALSPSGKISDPEQKKKAREELASGFLQSWGRSIEQQIKGPFIAGERIQVADIKLFQIVASLTNGVIDHIPKTVFSAFPKLEGVHAAVGQHPKVAEWRAGNASRSAK